MSPARKRLGKTPANYLLPLIVQVIRNPWAGGGCKWDKRNVNCRGHESSCWMWLSKHMLCARQKRASQLICLTNWGQAGKKLFISASDPLLTKHLQILPGLRATYHVEIIPEMTPVKPHGQPSTASSNPPGSHLKPPKGIQCPPSVSS